MSYQLEWKPSPNYTPGNQTQAFYGRPRTIEFGAGHWWGDPNAGYSHQGVINTFLNPARQASAHAVVSAGRVTEMVRQGDTAWCTNNANPFTFAIELKPNMTAADQETVAEYIADKGFHNIPWKPHKTWFATGCNPLDWEGIRQRAVQIYNDKHAPAPPAVPEWKKNLQKINNVTLFAIDDQTPLRNLANVTQVIKNFGKGTSFEIAAKTKVGNYEYYLTKYAYENGTGQGFDLYELKPEDPPVPEWQRNIVDIEDVELMVLPAEGTQVVNLNDGKAITPLAKGTWINIAKKTTVGGKVYLISKYSVDNAMPNGILQDHLGVPVVVPPVTKPEWLENWLDIEDVTMYTRVKAPLVNLLDGTTIKEIEINTPIEVASTTEWHGQKYAITKYSTDKQEARGIALVNLDKDPIKDPETPAEPDPEKPTDDLIRENNSLLKQLLALVQWIVDKLKGVK